MRRACLLVLMSLLAAGAGKRELAVDWIMQGPALYGWAPSGVRWARDGQNVYFQWKTHDAALLADPDTYIVNADGSGLRKLSREEEKDAPPAGGELSPDRSATAFVDRGDVFVYDHRAKKGLQITRTFDEETGARFTSDSRHVTYLRAGNLYRISLANGATEQMTEIRPEGTPPRPGESKGTDSQELLKREERSLLSVIDERAKRREEQEAKRRENLPQKGWTLAKRQSVTDAAISSDGEWVVVGIREGGDQNKKAAVPSYVTESAYTENLEARDKVGDAVSRSKLAIVNRRSGEHRWVEFGGKDHPVQIHFPQFSEDRSKAVLRARTLDNKEEMLLALDPAQAKVRELVKLRDEAWIQPVDFGWVGNDRIWFVSERDGWAHLYTVAFAGGEPKQLTSGAWEVRNVRLSEDQKTFYLTTSEASAAENQFYSLPVEGGARKRLTTKPGGHEGFVSPDGTTIASIYSYANTPPELYIGSKRVTQSPSPEFSSYPWIDPPVIEIPARDGAKLPARIYKAPAWKRGGPLVVFVHGAGYLQNAHKRWSQYAREYLFHHLLMERGYLVLDVDYRASAGYGRDWRTAVYRHMGGKDLDDQVDAVRWAIREHGADPKRIGIYGGSYGGFITLMALFTQPDVFAAGAALRPVTDWAHYNQPYTSNILNLPQTDIDAYKRSSPIYHAAGLKGALLICHGMVDVNVHYQDSVRLVEKLIELRKENWEFASYPVEDHAFVQPTSWADEYKRILRLFERTLRN